MARRLNVRLLGMVALFLVVPVAILAYVVFTVLPQAHNPQQYFQEAKQCLQNKEYGQAWIAIQTAIKQGGDRDPEVQYLKAQIAMKQNPPAGRAALQACRSAVTLKPDFVDAQRMYCELYMGARYWKEAKAEIERLIQMDPSFGKAYLWAGFVEMGMAEAEPNLTKRTPYYEAAVKRLQAGLEKEPSLLGLYDLMSRVYEKMGQNDKVDEVLNLAIANNPDKSEAYLLKSARLMTANKPDQASEVLKKGLEKTGEEPRLLVALGEVAVRKRNFDAAKEYLTKAAARDPKNELAYLRLSGVYRMEADYDKALTAVEGGLAQLPDSTNLLTDQADLLLDTADFKKAEEVIAKIEKAMPNAPSIAYLRGKRALIARQARQAIAYLEQAKEKQASPQARLLLGRAYLLVDELGAAQGELDSLIQDYPGLTPAWRTQAEVQFRLRDFEKAGRSAKVVLDINPDDIEMRMLLAQTFMARQRQQEALKEVQTAAERSKGNPDPYLLMADIQQAMNRPADAEASYRRAVAVADKDHLVRVYARFQQFFRTTKQDAKAKALVDEIAKALPADQARLFTETPEAIEKQLVEKAAKGDASPAELLTLGRIYQAAERRDMARDAYEKVLAQAKANSPEWRQGWQQMFLLRLAAEEYGKAADLIDQLKKVEAEAPELLFAEPLILLSRGKLAEATEQLRAVALSHKTMSQAHYLLGQVLFRQQKWDEAVQALVRALELRPNLLPGRLLLGRIYLGQGNNAGALNEATESLKFDPRLVAALEIKSAAYAGLGQWDNAVAARETIVNVVPDNVPNLIALAALYLQRHTPEKAEEVFNRALKLAPDNALLVRAFADFYAETSRPRQGEAIVDEYVGRHKNDSSAYVIRGEFTAKVSGAAEADKYYRKAAELAPNDTFPLVLLGDQYTKAAEWDKAAAVYLQAVERAKDDLGPRKRLADVYMLQGKLDQAKAFIDAVLKQAPKDAGAHVVAGRIAARRDKVEEARKHMEEALAIEPDYGEAKVRLAELYAGPDPLKALDILAGVSPSDMAFERAMLLRSDINTRRIQLRDAILDLRRLLDFRPTSFSGRMSLAAKYMAVQEPGRAAEILAQLSKERLDKDPTLLVALGDALSRQERWVDALPRYENARSLQPELSDALVGEVRCLVALKRNDEARKRIYAVMDKYSNEEWPRMALVAYYEKAGELDKAFEALRTGILRKENWEAGYVNLADLLMRVGRSDEARGVLLTGLAKVPKSVPIRAGLAAIDIGAGRAEAATNTLKPLATEFEVRYGREPDRIDQLRPYMAPVRIYALALYNMGKFDESLKWGMLLWSIDPTDVANANNMAWLLATEKNDFLRARDMIDRCKRLVPNHPQILDTSGWIYFLQDRPDDATEDLLASIKYGDNPEARYHLARIYQARQRLDEARAEYQKALDLGLKSKEKADAEKRLKQLASAAK